MDQKAIKLLEDLKKLVILQLIKGGAPSSAEEIGKALGITGRAIRNVATLSKRPRKKKTKKGKK